VGAVLAACSAEAGGAHTSDAAAAEQLGEGPRPEAGTDQAIAVAHDREMRGAWIATVWNQNWPSKVGLSADEAKAELITMLDGLASAKMNTVFFQVRTESDALYASPLEPWSRWLTGTQGQDPGWDPLAFVVEEGHRRGLEVHAWINPYRAAVNSLVKTDPSHVTQKIPAASRVYGRQLWMDPGAYEVREHILDVIRDIIVRYDVDGVHFDDYFYPYPVDGATFDDDAIYGAYTSNGGTLGKSAWRRSNVDRLVRDTADLVARTRSDVRFGISPFGIYRPGHPEGITGLDAYNELYCDPVLWMDQGWVDYLIPQLYWPTTRPAQAFGPLIAWWAGLAKGGRSIFAGHYADSAGTGAFTLPEFEAQMDLARAQRGRGVLGSVYFSAEPIVDDEVGLKTSLATKYWATPAATPPLATASTKLPGPPPAVTVDGSEVVVTTANARSVAVYREKSTGVFAIDRLVPAIAATRIKLDAGHWAVSLIDRHGVESRGTGVTLP
jgi:uncharacterized lipoprotein YddW (UPF0748 family)